MRFADFKHLRFKQSNSASMYVTSLRVWSTFFCLQSVHSYFPLSVGSRGRLNHSLLTHSAKLARTSFGYFASAHSLVCFWRKMMPYHLPNQELICTGHLTSARTFYVGIKYPKTQATGNAEQRKRNEQKHRRNALSDWLLFGECTPHLWPRVLHTKATAHTCCRNEPLCNTKDGV